MNPNTSFDVTRADKWLHGRARPRDRRVYEDWSKLLGLGRPGHWIAACTFEEFLAEVAVRHGRDPEELRRRLDAQARPPLRVPLAVQGASTSRPQLDGTVVVDKRALRIEGSDATQVSQYVAFTLFPPSPPVSVLAGLMFGTTLIGPDASVVALSPAGAVTAGRAGPPSGSVCCSSRHRATSP